MTGSIWNRVTMMALTHPTIPPISRVMMTARAAFMCAVAISWPSTLIDSDMFAAMDRSNTPATSETTDLLELCKQRGLLIGKGGLAGNTLRIKPPMCLTRDDADFLVDCLDEVLTLITERA